MRAAPPRAAAAGRCERDERDREREQRRRRDGDAGRALRMLGVICTPKLAERAADLADRAARPQRLAHGREEVRVGLGDPPDLGERARGGAASRSARTRAVRSRWRRSISGSTWSSSTSLALVLGEPVHADDDALARLDLGLVAERGRLDLRLDEPLLDRRDGAAELVDCARSAPARAARARR